MAQQYGDDLIPRTQLGWGTKAFLTILGLLLLAVVIFLIFPTNNSALPAWVPDLQTRLWTVLDFLAPYVVVALLGGNVGLAELTATFQTYPREALRTRWAWILVGVNGIAAILALMIVQATMPQMNVVLQVLGVGVGFQAIIRTKFVLAKPVGQKDNTNGVGEVSVNLGWLYDQFQNLCRTQIDLELMNNRRTAVTRLIKYYPSLAELYDIAWYTVIARATLTEEEEQKRLDRLERLIDPKAPENFAKTSIALLILENGGQAYVELLLNQAMQSSAPEALPMEMVTPEHLVRHMVENQTLDQLLEMAHRLTDNAEILNWIEEAAEPAPETSEASQKAAICHFLINQVGFEKVQQAVGSSSTLAS